MISDSPIHSRSDSVGAMQANFCLADSHLVKTRVVLLLLLYDLLEVPYLSPVKAVATSHPDSRRPARIRHIVSRALMPSSP